jgi:hypothetical protein
MPVNSKEKIPNYQKKPGKKRSERHSHVKNHPTHHPLREQANSLNARGWILSQGARFLLMPRIRED